MIKLVNTGLERIDSSIRDFLHGPLTIDISKSEHLLCDNLAWMANYYVCQKPPKTLIIDDAKCADTNQQLVDYFKSIIPKSKCQDAVAINAASRC